MGLNDLNVIWEMVVQRWGESLQLVLGSSKEIDHLPLGMGTGVGAACASNPYWLPRETGQCFFQLPLNRRRSDLELEPSIASALVFNQKGGPFKLLAHSVI